MKVLFSRVIKITNAKFMWFNGFFVKGCFWGTKKGNGIFFKNFQNAISRATAKITKFIDLFPAIYVPTRILFKHLSFKTTTAINTTLFRSQFACQKFSGLRHILSLLREKSKVNLWRLNFHWLKKIISSFLFKSQKISVVIEQKQT